MAEESGWRILNWAWERREEILKLLERLRKWVRGEEESDPKRAILILGSGGSGKSTLARFLSDPAGFDQSSIEQYKESLEIEREQLPGSPSVEVVVPPGQKHRRAATWTDLLQQLRAGEYRGVILVGAYGYQNLLVRSYQDHRLYTGDKTKFVEQLLISQRSDEIEILRMILSAVQGIRDRMWVLTVVTKADLWWNKQPEVENHYLTGPYQAEFASLSPQLELGTLRHEVAFTSLILNNFKTINGELLQKTVAGFDQPLQLQSLRELCEKLDALRKWERGS